MSEHAGTTPKAPSRSKRFTARSGSNGTRANGATAVAEPAIAEDEPQASPGELAEAIAQLAPGGRSPLWEVRDSPLPEAQNDSVVLKRDALFRRALAAVDLVAAAVAFLVATVVIGGGALHPRPAAVLLLPLVVIANKAVGLYDRDQYLLRKTTIDEVPQILHVSGLLALAVWLCQEVLVVGDFSRAEVLGLAATSFVVMTFGRLAARSVTLAATPPERCIVLGNAGSAERIARKVAGAPSVSATVIGRVALDTRRCDDFPDSPPMLGDADALPIILAEHGVERVIIAPDGHDQERILHSIRLVKALGVKVSVLPRLLEVVGSSSSFDELEGITLLGVRHYGLSNSSELLKRLMDAAVAALGLLALAPLLLILAIAIKLDSKGPVFFRQRRIGRGGEEFHMVKFRSMLHGADAMKAELLHRNESEGLFKIEDDPRITRVGRFLRRTSLDELPQLFNVLKGDMSLVGPRPLVPDEDALIEGWQRRRLAVKPGMTGLWQIFGSARIPMNEMVKIDYFYGANWSLWLDLKILLRTVPFVLNRRGL